jgi:4-amino-4-deoxy-L-arabinose transferase-like glycosyltransferase
MSSDSKINGLISFGRISNSDQRPIILLLFAFIVLALAYSIVNPIHEATDEIRHYRFVRTLATTGRLPIQGKEACRSQSHHPPLFYAIGAIATAWIDTGHEVCYEPQSNPFWAYRYWEVGTDNKNLYLHGQEESFPWYGETLAVHIIRAINVIIGAGVVLLTWATGRTIWPRHPSLAFGAAALVAFNPMFLYLSAAINNDVIAALAGAAVTFACVQVLRDDHGLSLRWGLIFGTLFGLALMSKFNLVAVLLLIEGVITWVAWRKNQWRIWLKVNLIIATIAGLIAGWWFIRNQFLYGEPTGFQEVTELWGARDPGASFDLAVSELPYAWTTLWGRFGYGQIPLPQTFYDLIQLFSIAGLVGAIYGYFRGSSRNERVCLVFLAANVLVLVLVLFNYMLVSPAGPNGRFFFPALSALSLLVFYGLSQLVWAVHILIKRQQPLVQNSSAQYDKDSGFLSVLTLIVMIILALVALTGYLAPAYARPESLALEADIPNPVRIQFDNLVTLLGYDLSTTVLRPGEAVDVDLYWEVNNQPPGDYLLFVHLIDEEVTMAAQRDTHPGLGSHPSSDWKSGDRFMESVRLYLPDTAYTPEVANIKVGLYAPDSYRLGVTGQDGELLGDDFTLASIELLPLDSNYPNYTNHSFDDEIRLIGYDYSRRTLSPGDRLEVTLYWEILQNLRDDYRIKVQLFDGDGKRRDKNHNGLLEAEISGDTLTAGAIILDKHNLKVESDAPKGEYVLDVMVLDPITGKKLNRVAEDGRRIGKELELARVRIDSGT